MLNSPDGENLNEKLSIITNENARLKVEIKKKAETIKKYQKKYHNLKNSIKENQKEDANEEIKKWKAVWEKVVSIMTEVVPFGIPKELNSSQQREILLEVTKKLYYYAINNYSGSAQFQNLQKKYQKNKQKLIKLKEQCKSLLDALQKNREKNMFKAHMENSKKINENLFDEQFKYLESLKQRSNSKFEPVYNDIYYKKRRDINYNSKCKNSGRKDKTRKNPSNHEIDSLPSTHDTDDHIKEMIQLDNEQIIQKNDDIISINNELVQIDKINEDDEMTKIDNSKALDQELEEIPLSTDASMEIRKMQNKSKQINSYTKAILAQDNLNAFNFQMFHHPLSLSNPKSLNIINNDSNIYSQPDQQPQQKETELAPKIEEIPIEIEKNVSKNVNHAPTINASKTEFSEAAAEQVVEELEKTKTTESKKNENHIRKKDLMDHRIKYGRRVNELIDVANKLKDQYNLIEKKYKMNNKKTNENSGPISPINDLVLQNNA